MIKKILSIFMAFSCIFSAGTPIFADDNELFPVDYLKRHQVQTKIPTGTFLFSIDKKKKVAQKAFLTALACSLGINIEIKIHRIGSKVPINFTVQKIGDSDLHSLSADDHDPQISALLDALRNKNHKFEIKSSKVFTIYSAKINNHFLNQNTILKIGEKVLKLIYEEKQLAIRSHIISEHLNLTHDISFRNKVFNIIGELLKNNPPKDENTLSFFELPSDSKKLEPITNPDHVNYLKEHPDTASKLTICYQKAFFTGLLSNSGIKTFIRLPGKREKNDLPNCIILKKVGNFGFKTSGITSIYLTNFIKLVNSIFDSKKLKIEALQASNLIPTKVIIENKIYLDENDIFNLGQRFYNLFYKLTCENIIKHPPCTILCLNEIPKFTQGVKEIFKDYTGINLPNLK